MPGSRDQTDEVNIFGSGISHSEFGPAPSSSGTVLVRRDASRPAADERVLLRVTFRDEPLVEETRVSSGWLARPDSAQHKGRRREPGDGARQIHAERWVSALRLERIEPAAQRGARHRRSGSSCRFQAERRTGRTGRDRGNRRRRVRLDDGRASPRRPAACEKPITPTPLRPHLACGTQIGAGIEGVAGLPEPMVPIHFAPADSLGLAQTDCYRPKNPRFRAGVRLWGRQRRTGLVEIPQTRALISVGR